MLYSSIYYRTWECGLGLTPSLDSFAANNIEETACNRSLYSFYLVIGSVHLFLFIQILLLFSSWHIIDNSKIFFIAEEIRVLTYFSENIRKGTNDYNSIVFFIIWSSKRAWQESLNIKWTVILSDSCRPWTVINPR